MVLLESRFLHFDSMQVHENILRTIGNTPLVKLSRVTRGLSCQILAKLEFFNPGGSVKDRIALPILEAYEQSGALLPGGTVVEASLIGKMHDSRGRVTLPGFYDDVRELSEEERADLADLPQSDEWWRQQSGASVLGGEQGYTTTERATARPTLDVNGLLSGFIGEGGKTVLPSRAMAKISMRLVRDQEPDRVHESLLSFMREHAPPGVSWEVEMFTGSVASVMDRESYEAEAALEALEAVWGVPARFKREGGSVPVVGMIEEMLDVKTLLLGFGLPDDNLHAPNEKFHLPNFHRGIDTYVHFMSSLAA